MKIKYLAALPILMAVYACAPKGNQGTSAQNSDFDVFCDQFTTLVNADNYSELTAVERSAELDSLLSGKLPASSNAYQAWAAIRNAPPAQRSMLYKDAAKSAGFADWNCFAIAEHGNQVGSH